MPQGCQCQGLPVGGAKLKGCDFLPVDGAKLTFLTLYFLAFCRVFGNAFWSAKYLSFRQALQSLPDISASVGITAIGLAFA